MYKHVINIHDAGQTIYTGQTTIYLISRVVIN